LKNTTKASYKSFEYPEQKVSKKEESLYDVESFLSLKIILSFTKIEVLSLMVLHLYKVPNRGHQAKLLENLKRR
jgi:hypothetical protein